MTEELLFPVRLVLGPCNGRQIEIPATQWHSGTVLVTHPFNPTLACEYERYGDRWLHERTTGKRENAPGSGS